MGCSSIIKSLALILDHCWEGDQDRLLCNDSSCLVCSELLRSWEVLSLLHYARFHCHDHHNPIRTIANIINSIITITITIVTSITSARTHLVLMSFKTPSVEPSAPSPLLHLNLPLSSCCNIIISIDVASPCAVKHQPVPSPKHCLVSSKNHPCNRFLPPQPVPLRIGPPLPLLSLALHHFQQWPAICR